MNDLLTIPELAALLRVKPATIRAWRRLGIDPPSLRVGRRVLYRASVVDRWLVDKERATEAAREGGAE